MYSRRVALLVLGACSSDGNHSSTPPDGTSDGSGSPSSPYRIMAAAKLAADPSIKNRVIVVGTNDDGSPALDDLVLGFDRPGAGMYTEPAVTLGNLGATSFFRGCELSTPGCAGPLQLTAALASAPTTPIATLDVELVDPLDVNPAKPCLGGGNVLYLKGNDQIFNGETTITNATWEITSPYPELLTMRVTPPGATGNWTLTFDSRAIAPFLVPDVYENAARTTLQSDLERDRPAMEVKGFGNQCTTLVGRYEVLPPFVVSSSTQAFTIAFEQHCDGAPNKVLTGCVHYQ